MTGSVTTAQLVARAPVAGRLLQVLGRRGRPPERRRRRLGGDVQMQPRHPVHGLLVDHPTIREGTRVLGRRVAGRQRAGGLARPRPERSRRCGQHQLRKVLVECGDAGGILSESRQ
ncbi:MAG TPA: hypothetical protein VFN24_04865 [Microbacterium sp.]|nr:hypothetical protein [Microbacterium sp.]